jgi:hypothetical protein
MLVQPVVTWTRTKGATGVPRQFLRGFLLWQSPGPTRAAPTNFPITYSLASQITPLYR